MIGAAIAISIALVALAGAFVWFGAALLGESRGRADARVDAQDMRGKLAIATADVETHRKRADYQERRANALDEELDTVADSGDPATARERVLARLKAAEARGTDPANGDSAELVPDGEPGPHAQVEGIDDTALERPGG